MVKNTNPYKDFLKMSGVLAESNDFLTIRNVIPSLELVKMQSEEVAEKVDAVLQSLHEIKEALQKNPNSVHLPAQASYLTGILRESLSNALQMEQNIRKSLTVIENM